MTDSCSTPATSVLGLALTLDPFSSALPATLALLRARPGVVMEEPQFPFAAVALETADARADHAWLESLPGIIAVDVVFVEVLGDDTASERAARPRRRRSRDPLDDSLQPISPPDCPTDLDLPTV